MPASRTPDADHVGRGVPGMAKEVRPIVPGNRIVGQHVGKPWNAAESKAFLIDISQRSHGSPVAHSQEIKIVRMFAIFGQHRNGIEARSIVMQLALQPAVFGARK